MKIEQFSISAGVWTFKGFYEKNYGLRCVNNDNYDTNAPCLFVGNYHEEDHKSIVNHKGHATVIWCGQDAMLPQNIDAVREKEARHISISKWISDKLYRYGIEFEELIFPTTTLDDWKPCPLGDKIYSYAPTELYNKSMIERIAKASPYQVIVSDSPTKFTKDQLKEIYSQCFLGLRLTWWDGSPATVQEMGMMGRRTIWNGGRFGSIPWTTEESVLESIEREAEKIGTSPTEFAENCRKELDISKDWLEING